MNYELLTDEELLTLTKNGNQFALEALLVRHKKLVKRICRSYFLIGAEPEDLVQEGMIGLSSAIQCYNGESSFYAFASLCITRKVQEAVKLANRQKHLAMNKSLSLNSNIAQAEEDEETELLFLIPSSALTPDEELEQKESLRELKNALNDNLSNLEKKVLGLYLQGLSYAFIATRVERDSKSVENALLRTRQKVQDIITKKIV